MVGRAAYKEPWRLLDVDPQGFCAEAPFPSVETAAEAMIPYIERETAAGTRAPAILRHMVGLFHAVPGARRFRQILTVDAVKPGAGSEVLREALRLVAARRVPIAEPAAA